MTQEFKTPKELIDAYSNGMKGFNFNARDTEDFHQSMQYANFGDAAPWLDGSGKGKLSMPFKSVLKFDKDAFQEAQKTGDCESHGNRNAADITRAVEIDIKGDAEEWITRGATEVLYGMRGHCGQGANAATMVKLLTRITGVALRQKYGKWDLTSYNVRLGMSEWCPANVPDEILSTTNKHCIQTATLIKTVEQARDALANGYGIAYSGGQGFSSTRDSNGFARPQGSWSHCMCVGGCNDLDGNMDFLIINSWGPLWISGPMPKFGSIPSGGFMIHAETMQNMINSGGTYVMSNFSGFPQQKLPDYGTMDFL